MKKTYFNILWLILLVGAACKAAPLPSSLVKIKAHGQTEVAITLEGKKILVEIDTHEMDIGKPSERRPEKPLSSCTYARFPCSPVDHLDISINGKTLFVARSVYADLADVNSAVLHKEKDSFVLTLVGGDASEGYTVNVIFDESLVRKRELISSETGQVMQETIYSLPAVMD